MAIGILHYAVKLISAIGQRKQLQEEADSPERVSASHPECGLLSGQFMTIMNQQTDLMRQMVALTSKLESGLIDVKSVAVDNSHRLDSVVNKVSLVLDRQRPGGSITS